MKTMSLHHTVLRFCALPVVKRIITAILLIPVALIFLQTGGSLLCIAMGVLCIGCIFELISMLYVSKYLSRRKKISIGIVGSFYILSAFLFSSQATYHINLWILICVWSSDTGAYCFGRLLKGPKLAPSISPGKTWSGFLCGSGIGIICGFYSGIYLTINTNIPYFMYSTLILVIIGHLGDLLESWVKRQCHVKDSGSCFPGHGGMLDRLDSLIAIWAFLGGVSIILNYLPKIGL